MRIDRFAVTVAGLLVLSLAVGATPTPASGAVPSLESFVLAAGGNSSGPLGGCTTFQQPAPAGAFFGSGVGLPLDGLAACGVAGGFDDLTAATGPIAGSRPLSSSWSGSTFDGNSSAQADYGNLAATGHSVFAGSTSSTTVTAAEGFGRCNDVFTITSPSVPAGQAGTVRFMVTVTGGLSAAGNGGASVELNYAVGGSSSHYSMFGSSVYGSGSLPSLHSLDGNGLSGFVTAPGAMSGSGEVTTFAHAIVFGTPIELDFGMMAYSGPGASSTVDSHFQAYVSHIEVTGPLGQVLPDFVASAASGTHYGSAGIAGVDGLSRTGDDSVRLTAYPNPTGAQIRLSYRLPLHTTPRLGIYDSAGRLVRVLRAGPVQPGATQEALWDGRDDRGTLAPIGTYFARLRWDGGSSTTRLVLLR